MGKIEIKVMRIWIIIVFIVLFAAVCGGYLLSGREIRYELAISLNYNGVAIGGKNTWKIKRFDTTKIIGPLGGFGYEVEGDAVEIRIDDSSSIFFLMEDSGRSSPQDILYHAFKGRLSEFDSSTTNWVSHLSRLGGVSNIDIGLLPRAVYFRDVNNPASARFINVNQDIMPHDKGLRFTSAELRIVRSGFFPFNIVNICYVDWIFGRCIELSIQSRLKWLAMPWTEQAKLLKGPLWDPRDKGFVFGQNLTPSLFKRGY